MVPAALRLTPPGRSRALPAALAAFAACWALLAAACGTPEPRFAGLDGRQPQAPPTRPAALAEATLDSPRIRVRLTEVARTGPGTLTVTLVVANPDPAAPLSLGATFAAAQADADSIADVQVIDEAHEKKYFVLRDDQGRPACSQGIGEIPAGEQRAVWVKVAAPPAAVDRVTVQVPRLPPFKNVPVTPPAAR